MLLLLNDLQSVFGVIRDATWPNGFEVDGTVREI